MDEILKDFYTHKNQMIKLIENTPKGTTKALTQFIVEYFVKKELVIEREVKTRFHTDFKKPSKNYNMKRIRGAHREGFLDLRISKFMNTESIMDIEIDRYNKKSSVGKLIYSKNTLNHKVLWIRWGWGRYRMENSMKNLIDENEIPILYLF